MRLGSFGFKGYAYGHYIMYCIHDFAFTSLCLLTMVFIYTFCPPVSRPVLCMALSQVGCVTRDTGLGNTTGFRTIVICA